MTTTYGYSIDGGRTWVKDTDSNSQFVIGTYSSIYKKWYPKVRLPAPNSNGDGGGTVQPAFKREQIAIINSSTVLTDDVVKQYTKDFQTALDRDFTHVWGIAAELVFVGKGQTPPAGSWWLTFLDNSDVADALGYHDITSDGQPLGKSFAKTDIDNGYNPSITATHELWEMLVDPWISLTAQVQLSNGATRDYALETGDPVESDVYGYKVGSTMISDFVYPSWFEPFRKAGSTMFDYQNKVTKPLQLLSGGYLQYLDLNNVSAGWQQQFADKVTQNAGAHRNTFKYSQLAPKGSRRERRIRGKLNWLLSKADFKAIPRILARL